MRNAPVKSLDNVASMLGGQRYSAALPWYRGAINAPMEIENQALCQVVKEELLTRRFSIALDCHSGFGLRDRLWFPYAHTRTPIAHLPDIGALEELFAATYPNHHYLFKPQSRQYLTHGHIWDCLYRETCGDHNRTFLPLTLEMGSWLWVKKNPHQLFSRQGFFSPVPLHRLNRVLRSHLVWLDFLARAAAGHQRWLPVDTERELPHGRVATLVCGQPFMTHWILLHGLMREARHWHDFLRHLHRHCRAACRYCLTCPATACSIELQALSASRR